MENILAFLQHSNDVIFFNRNTDSSSASVSRLNCSIFSLFWRSHPSFSNKNVGEFLARSERCPQNCYGVIFSLLADATCVPSAQKRQISIRCPSQDGLFSQVIASFFTFIKDSLAGEFWEGQVSSNRAIMKYL